MILKSLYPDLPKLPPMNFYHLCLGREDQKAWPDFTFQIDGNSGRKRSFREFVSRVEDGATALGAPTSSSGLGLRAENAEMVGLIGPNTMDYVCLVHSLLKIAVPIVFLSCYETTHELTRSLKLSSCTRIFAHPSMLKTTQAAAEAAGISLDKIYVMEGYADGKQSFDSLIRDIVRRKCPKEPPRVAGKDTLAYLVFSSGTSGPPKAVMISHGNLAVSLLQGITIGAAIAAVSPPAPSEVEVTLAFLPMHHSYGMHMYCFRAFLKPSTFILMLWDVDSVLAMVPKYKVTALSLVPSMVHQLVNSGKLEKADLSSVKLWGSGAAYLPPKLASAVMKGTPGAVMLEGYGMSETTLSAIMRPFPGTLNGLAPVKAGSMGILLPGMEAQILHEDGRTECAIDEVGELFVRGGCVSLGYWKNEEETKKTFNVIEGGWLRTGDRMRVDKDSVYFFEDRVKDTLKVSGMQVSPVEIENALLDHPDKLVIDAAVGGVSGGRTSDEKVPRAWVVLSATGEEMGVDAVVSALHKWTQERLSKYKQLRGGIEVISQIPKLPTGKVLRRKLQADYEENRARALQESKSKL